MKRKIIGLLLVAVFFAPLTSSCSDITYPGEANDIIRGGEKINFAVATAIEEGRLQQMMPPTIVMVFGIMVPITAITGFFLFLIIYARLNHRRSMAMIEKGTYQKEKWRWDLIILFTGLVLTFVGAGISITTVSYFGPQPWTFMSGIIPLFLGIAFLIFYRVSDFEGKS